MTEQMTFSLGGRQLGLGQRCLVVGEVAQAHDGSLGLAHALIDVIANAGADAVKFQTHMAAAESTPEEPFRVPGSGQDATRYDYWKRMEFTEAQWQQLATHARARGLVFLSSPFSVEAVGLLSRLGVPAWKIPSGELTNTPMIERLLETNLPILISTGMSSLSEIDEAVRMIRTHRVPFLVFQSTSLYPCPPEKIGLNLIPFFRKRYRCPVGLSDHSGAIAPGLAAAVLGAEMVEVHVTLNHEMGGPDGPVSITSIELKQLVESIRMIERLRANPVDKDTLARELAPMRRLFCKSLVARTNLAAGIVVQWSHLAIKKPGTGIAAGRIHEFIGRRLRREVAADALLREDDFEPVLEPMKRSQYA